MCSSSTSIWRKLQKLELKLTTPTLRMVELAFRLFDDWHLEVKAKEDKRERRMANIWAFILQETGLL
jgi:hypothetical protein